MITVNLHTPLLPHRRDKKLREEGGGGKCNFQRGAGSYKKSLGWGGMDIFWKYTLQYMYFQVHYGMWLWGFS